MGRTSGTVNANGSSVHPRRSRSCQPVSDGNDLRDTFAAASAEDVPSLKLLLFGTLRDRPRKWAAEESLSGAWAVVTSALHHPKGLEKCRR